MSFSTFLRIKGVTFFLNHEKTIILVSNVPWLLSVSSQSNKFRSSCFRRALLIHTSCLASSIVMPVPRMFLQLPQPFELESGGHSVQTDNFIGHLNAFFIEIRSQGLNGVRGDLVLISHAFLPPIVFILCTARRIRNSASQKLPPCREDSQSSQTTCRQTFSRAPAPSVRE